VALDAGVVQLGQRQTMKASLIGGMQDVIEISFTVDNMGPFTIDIPADRYIPEIVERDLGEFVDKVRKTSGLFSGS
jgi:hypothetical protein